MVGVFVAGAWRVLRERVGPFLRERVGPFLRGNLLTVVLIAVVAVQFFQIRGLRGELKTPLTSEKVERAAEKGTPEAPVVVNISVPGTGTTTPAIIFTQPPQPAVPATGDKPAAPAQPPRVVARTGSVFCETREECLRILGSSPQTVHASGYLKAGTVVPVIVNGKVVNAPLAENYRFSMDFALAEPGVFVAVNPVDSPLVISEVETRTVVVEVPRVEMRLPYNLAFVPAEAIFTNAGVSAFTGFIYQNYTLGTRGVYVLGVGYAWPGLAGKIGFHIPLR